MTKIKEILGLFIFTILLLSSCKNTVLYGPDPYTGGKEPSLIRFATELPVPSQGKVGTPMTFKVYGAAPYKEKLQFFISGIPAEVTVVTDSTITAVLPENVSTGSSSLTVDGQLFLGPICRVVGKVNLDPTFNAGLGSNGVIYTIRQLKNGQVFIGGGFTNYNGQAATAKINGIARITPNGEFVSGMTFGAGVIGGSVLDIHALNDGNLLLSGVILNYDSVTMVNNLVKINPSGALIKQKVNVLNLTDDPAKSTLDVPVFNGGTDYGIAKSFVLGNTLTAIGGFENYVDRYYPRSTYDNILVGRFNVGSVVRMHLDGTLDSTFNINKGSIPAKANNGFFGFISDGYLDADGKLIVVGRFNRYNNTTVVGNIVRLNRDGSLDKSFETGTGVNNTIETISYSSMGKKYFLTGDFLSYNQVEALNMVMLNTDGSLDRSFKSLGFSGGFPNFVRELANGLILVAGSFTKYGNVVREGLCFLNPDGSLAKDYNNTGKLDGTVFDALEGKNSLGQRTVTLVGSIKRFDGNRGIGNIIRLSLQD